MVIFKQHTSHIKLSNDDKLIRYRKHLSTFIKDWLAETDWVHNMFNTIVTIAMDIDKWYRKQIAEKAREASHSASTPSSKPLGTH